MSALIPQALGHPANVKSASSSHFSAAQPNAWQLLGWLGFAYLLMSVTDLALGWYPLKFGTAEWEFGTISATISDLAIPALALYLILCSAIARGSAKVIQAVSIVLIALAVSLTILFILYLTAVPLALRAVSTNPIIHLGMKKAIFKSLTLFIGYEALFVLGGLKGLRLRTIVAVPGYPAT
jgi:hypothetical protein